jgi:hypothetical protein
VYEGLATLAVAAAVLVVQAFGAFRAPDGRLILLAAAGWAAIRAAVSVSWRDEAVLGVLPAGGVLALAIAAVSLALLVGASIWLPRRAATRPAGSGDPAWPDPEARPQF